MATLSPLQITAGAGLLQDQGLRIDPVLVAGVAGYDAQPPIIPLVSAFGIVNSGTAGITSATGNAIKTIANTTVPAFGDTVGNTYTNINITGNTTTGFADLLITQANIDLGSGDLTKFVQAFNLVQGYASSSNQFINSSVNSQNYLSDTFTNFNSLTTGGIADVNSNPELFGQDLANLGSLIDLGNLGDLGSPLALLQQLSNLNGVTPAVSVIFAANGVSLDTILNLKQSATQAQDSDQKKLYQAMTQITGDTLSQVLQVFGVTTANINTMADLLNPYKIFPNSFQTLTVVDINGVLQNIYINATGGVNSTLATTLPPAVLVTLS